MIRKAVIVVLTLGAVVTGVVYVATGDTAKVWSWYRNDTTWVEVGLNRGVVSILIIEDTGYQMFPVFIKSFAYARNLVRERHGSPPTFRNLPPLPAGMKPSGRTFPILPLVGLFAAYPTIAFIRGPLRRWRRRRKGLCLACGYDLTGNVTGVCSECGTAGR
jgi:hypothetical protein